MSSFEPLVLSPLSIAQLHPETRISLQGARELLRDGFRGRLNLHLPELQGAADWARLASLLAGSAVGDWWPQERVSARECPLLCLGGLQPETGEIRVLVFSDAVRGLYRRLLLRNGRLYGLLALGELPQAACWSSAIGAGLRMTQRRLWQFQQDGSLALDAGLPAAPRAGHRLAALFS